ncbi:MAG: hypothetical protein CM15mP46_0380 [Alphaproteobacteria bacterium]|nr:MAG: hypothetical protein CM15mP46_0380 [Alphaproteobacteria bacterium]
MRRNTSPHESPDSAPDDRQYAETDNIKTNNIQTDDIAADPPTETSSAAQDQHSGYCRAIYQASNKWLTRL